MPVDVAYIFPGQGSQYVGMGKELYEAFPESREVFDKAGEILKFDLIKLCFEGPKDELTNTANSQVAIMVHSIAALKAMARLTEDVQAVGEAPRDNTDQRSEQPAEKAAKYVPKFSMGLSLGEYSALVASGCLSLEDAVVLVRKRGQFMEAASKKVEGKMVSLIGMSLGDVESLCKGIGGCEIANLNCPGQVVVSGKAANIELLAGLAKDKGAKRAILLDVSGAFHSSLMTPAKEKLEKEIEKAAFNPPSHPVVSNVTAEPTQDPAVIKENLITQVNSRTLFEASVRYVASQGIQTFIEIGPGTVLKGLLRKIDKKLEVINIEKPCHLDQQPVSL